VCIRRQIGVFKYFPDLSRAGEVYLNTSPASEKYFYIYYTYLIYLSGAGEAWEVFKTPFRRRRSTYIHLPATGEAGKAGEVFIYTRLIN